MQKDILGYYQDQQISSQWLDFLRILAKELMEQADSEELHSLMFSTGDRLAAAFDGKLPRITDLDCLEDELNAYWRYMNWGYVHLDEDSDQISIAHYACPLATAFGEDALPWAIGFLEGFYQKIFHSLGASPHLRIRSADAPQDPLQLNFQFGLDPIFKR